MPDLPILVQAMVRAVDQIGHFLVFAWAAAAIDYVGHFCGALLAREEGHACVLLLQLASRLIFVAVDAFGVPAFLSHGVAARTIFGCSGSLRLRLRLVVGVVLFCRA